MWLLNFDPLASQLPRHMVVGCHPAEAKRLASGTQVVTDSLPGRYQSSLLVQGEAGSRGGADGSVSIHVLSASLSVLAGLACVSPDRNSELTSP